MIERGSTFIEAKGVNKLYSARDGGVVMALVPLDFRVAEGEFVCIVGPSGCGKSTLLKMLAGILPVSNGVLSLAGRPITGPRPDIGVVFQTPMLLPWRTVFENVMLPIELQRLDRVAYGEIARRLLSLVGLADFADRFPSELSGGMQQRTGICRALVHDPKLLLMDEPFGSLDAMTRETLNIELQRIWQERQKTILFVTHSILEAVFLADRVLVMTARPGRIRDIVEVGLTRPRHPSVTSTPDFGRLADRIRGHFDIVGASDL